MKRFVDRIEQQLRELGRNWAAAELRGDTDSLEHLLSDAFVGTSSRGFMLSKEEWLDRHRSGELKHDAFIWDDENVRVYEDAALVTGRETVRGRYRDHQVDEQFRATQVFVCQDGRWMLAGIDLAPVVDEAV
jgi:hypothetical protein